MNIVCLIGRLTKDPDIRYTPDEQPLAIGRYTLAVDRAAKQKQTDFIPCVCFGKTAEFAEKYLKQGTKVGVTGQIQTGSYIGKDGAKVYTWNVHVDKHDFADKAPEQPTTREKDEGFLDIPAGIDEELPFI